MVVKESCNLLVTGGTGLVGSAIEADVKLDSLYDLRDKMDVNIGRAKSKPNTVVISDQNDQFQTYNLL